jgi:hypothetical protein
MTLFAYIVHDPEGHRFGEIEAPDEAAARAIVRSRFPDAKIHKLFEPPPHHGERRADQRAARPRLNRRFDIYEQTVRKEHGKPVHR